MWTVKNGLWRLVSPLPFREFQVRPIGEQTRNREEWAQTLVNLSA
jgi:hypothetical protein